MKIFILKRTRCVIILYYIKDKEFINNCKNNNTIV